MLKYFIDTTANIIEENGIDGVTIRKIAELSGYNSATIYNYFENLDHLIFLASLRFIKPYATSVADYAKKGKNSLEKNILIWEYFACIHLKIPNYTMLFFLLGSVARLITTSLNTTHFIPMNLSKTILMYLAC